MAWIIGLEEDEVVRMFRLLVVLLAVAAPISAYGVFAQTREQQREVDCRAGKMPPDYFLNGDCRCHEKFKYFTKEYEQCEDDVRRATERQRQFEAWCWESSLFRLANSDCPKETYKQRK